MHWQFELYYNYHRVKIKAEIIYSTAQIERIKLTTGTHQMIVENNRPLLMSKNLKRKRIQWKVKEGSINNTHAYSLMIESMEAYLRSLHKEPFTHPKGS